MTLGDPNDRIDLFLVHVLVDQEVAGLDEHHNNTNCNTGNNIEKENVRTGTGGKPLCAECAKLNSQGR